LATEQNPSFGDSLPPSPNEPSPGAPLSSVPPPDHAGENPPWSGWDVLQIVVLTVFVVGVFVFAATYGAQRLFYPHKSMKEVALMPLVSVVAQMCAYLVVLAFMVAIVKRNPQRSFWDAVKWRWPKAWSAYLAAGLVMAFALQGVAHLLPMPKELPIDRFFQTTAEAWALSFFGVTLAPLMEELFFRGFLYPVLARRLGVSTAVVLTSICFGLIHAPQLGHAWGPVLVVFLVGLILTIVRTVTRSVAPGFLMHVAYNGTISLLLFAGSGGFRHLDRLK
jgi:CAAX protease family protein